MHMHPTAAKFLHCVMAAALFSAIPHLQVHAQVRKPIAVVSRISVISPVATSTRISAAIGESAGPYVLTGAVVGAVAAVLLFARPVYEAEFAPAWVVYGGVGLIGAGVGALVGRLVFDAIQ